MVHDEPAPHDRHDHNTDWIAHRNPVLDQGVVMTSTRRTAGTALLVLSLAAAGAPAASARPADFVPAGKQAPTSVYSRPDKSEIPVSPPATSGADLSAYREGQLAAAFDVAATAANRASAQQAVVRIQTPQGGFDWGDAGIGAAGGIALTMLGLGGALGVSQRRTRRTRHTAALTS
jgi:hypothetical protein